MLDRRQHASAGTWSRSEWGSLARPCPKQTPPADGSLLIWRLCTSLPLCRTYQLTKTCVRLITVCLYINALIYIIHTCVSHNFVYTLMLRYVQYLPCLLSNLMLFSVLHLLLSPSPSLSFSLSPALSPSPSLSLSLSCSLSPSCLSPSLSFLLSLPLLLSLSLSLSSLSFLLSLPLLLFISFFSHSCQVLF